MATVFLAPAPILNTQFIPGGNVPASGGQLFAYISGSSTKLNTYTTSSGSVANANPYVLDSGGNLTGSREIWLIQSSTYRFVLAPSNDTDPPSSPYWTMDSISGVNDVPNQTGLEWIISSTAPVFAASSSFALPGDQTATFTLGRRVKTTNTGGTIYGTVTSSAFTTSTAVGIATDSGALDSGLSAVSYGLLSTPNGSVPWTNVRTTGLDFSKGVVTTGPLIVTALATFTSTSVFNNKATISTATINGLLDLSSTTAGQISFPSVQNATSSPNILDDYEEGTWTPIWNGISGATTVASTGVYTKIGDLVFISFALTLGNKGSSTGTLSLGALPFPPQTSATVFMPLQWQNLTSSWGELYLNVNATSGVLTGHKVESVTYNIDNFLWADLSNSSSIFGSGVYKSI